MIAVTQDKYSIRIFVAHFFANRKRFTSENHYPIGARAREGGSSIPPSTQRTKRSPEIGGRADCACGRTTRPAGPARGKDLSLLRIAAVKELPQSRNCGIIVGLSKWRLPLGNRSPLLSPTRAS